MTRPDSDAGCMGQCLKNQAKQGEMSLEELKQWHSLGSAEALKIELSENGLKQIAIQSKKFALSYRNGKFGAVHGVCNHVGGPLGKGRLEGDYIVCPWHYWKFHRLTGEGEPGYEEDRVPRFDLKEEQGELLVCLDRKSVV